MTSDSQILPNDAMFEILTYVNLDDFPAWRQVNREIYNITKETTFKTQHCVKTNAVSGYLIGTNSKYSFISENPIKSQIKYLDILKKHDTIIETVSQCRGLICYSDNEHGKERFYVCKPTTEQRRAIPNPDIRFRTVATAMIANTVGPLNFKIIRLSIPTSNKICLTCEIFDSLTWSWRRSKDIENSIYFPGYGLDRQCRAVFANGSVHWLIRDFIRKKIFIFAFDLEKEIWKVIQVPPKYLNVEMKWRSKILARDGKLCYVILTDDAEMIVWTMEIYKTKAWWRKETVKCKEEEKLNEGWLEFYMEFFYCSNFGAFDPYFTDLWENFWKSKLSKFGLKEFFVGDAFKIESDFVHCECLASKSLA